MCYAGRDGSRPARNGCVLSTMQVFHLRPKWRLITPQKQQEVTLGTSPALRDVKNEGRTDYVYENKGSSDKMSCIGGAFFAFLSQIDRILQIWRGQSVLNCIFATGFAE